METKAAEHEIPVLQEGRGADITSEQLVCAEENKSERMVALDVEDDEAYELAI